MPRWRSQTRGVAVVAIRDDSDAGLRAARRRWLVLALVTVLLAGACGGAAVNVPESAAVAVPAPQGEPIVIGGTLSLTGPRSAVSAEIMAAYDLWVDDVNDSGGLLGRPVELIIYDDHSRSDSARSLYQRLIAQDQVDLLLAPDSAATPEVLPLAEHDEMLLFNGDVASATVRSDWLVDAYTYTEPDYSRAVFEMIDDLPEEQRPRRIGIAATRDPSMLLVRDGIDGRGGVRRFARQRDIDIVVDVEYAAAAADVHTIAEQARDGDVDLFFALAHVPDAVLLARAAERVGFAPKVFCSCGASVAGLSDWDDLGAAGNGIVSTAMTWSSDSYPGIETLSSHVRSTGQREGLPVHMTGAYAILQVLHHVVDGAGEIDQHALRDQLAGRTVETAAGPIAFDRHHTPAYRAVVVQSRADGDQVVWPPERATSQVRMPIGD